MKTAPRTIALLVILASFALAQTIPPRPPFGGQINSVSGSGRTMVTTTGSQIVGRCVEVDANGNHVPAADVCGSGGGGVSDGDKGDVVISSSGTVYSFDTGVVTAAARTVLDDASVADMRTTLGLVIGTDVLAPNGSAASLTSFPTLNQNTTGSAATLTTPRTIGGVSFNGSANIVPSTITVADTTDTTSSCALFESATGDLSPKTDAGCTYNAATGMLTATGFTGPLTGNVNGTIGGVTPAAGAFTTVSATGQITSTVSTGTAPFVVASTTVVANLNASALGGATFAAPGTIGSGTPGAGFFDSLTVGSNAASFATVSSFTLPSAAAPTVSAVGQVFVDTNLWAASRGAILNHDGTAATALVGTLVSDTPTDGQCVKWNTGGTITWEDCAASGVSSIDTATGAILLGAGLTRSSQTISFDSAVLSGVYASIAGPNAFTAGGKNTWQADATTAGARIVPTANPSSPAGGDLNVDLEGDFFVYDGAIQRGMVSNAAGQDLRALSTGFAKITTTTGAFTTVVPATGVETFITTPTSANLAAALTNETGSGLVPFVTAASSTVGQVLRVTGAAAYDWGALDLADTDATTGNLPVSRLNSGTSASSSTFWRGDGTWAAAGGGAVVYHLAPYQCSNAGSSPAWHWGATSVSGDFAGACPGGNPNGGVKWSVNTTSANYITKELVFLPGTHTYDLKLLTFNESSASGNQGWVFESGCASDAGGVAYTLPSLNSNGTQSGALTGTDQILALTWTTFDVTGCTANDRLVLKLYRDNGIGSNAADPAFIMNVIMTVN